jgi:hypothetical protein
MGEDEDAIIEIEHLRIRNQMISHGSITFVGAQHRQKWTSIGDPSGT